MDEETRDAVREAYADVQRVFDIVGNLDNSDEESNRQVKKLAEEMGERRLFMAAVVLDSIAKSIHYLAHPWEFTEPGERTEIESGDLVDLAMLGTTDLSEVLNDRPGEL